MWRWWRVALSVVLSLVCRVFLGAVLLYRCQCCTASLHRLRACHRVTASHLPLHSLLCVVDPGGAGAAGISTHVTLLSVPIDSKWPTGHRDAVRTAKKVSQKHVARSKKRTHQVSDEAPGPETASLPLRRNFKVARRGVQPAEPDSEPAQLDRDGDAKGADASDPGKCRPSGFVPLPMRVHLHGCWQFMLTMSSLCP